MSNSVDAPPHAMFRVLIRWGRFVFESHAAPSKGGVGSEAATAAKHGPRSDPNHGGGSGGGAVDSSQHGHGAEYRVVWFRAIDGVAIGHTKWCPLTVLHNVVSVVDFQNAAAVVDIAAGYMVNTATRVILLQLQQRYIDPTSDAAQQVASRSIVAATGAVDIGMFVGSPPRSYIVTLEASFFAVGKLHMNLVVKEPRIDDSDESKKYVNRVMRQRMRRISPDRQQQEHGGVGRSRGSRGDDGEGSSVEKLVVLVVDSIESLREDGGKLRNVGVYGIARLLQDKNSEDYKRFPLPANSTYQLKVAFVLDSKYVARPQLVRNSATVDSSKAGATSSSRAPARDTTVVRQRSGAGAADFDGMKPSRQNDNDDDDDDDDDKNNHERQMLIKMNEQSGVPRFRGAATSNLGDFVDDDDNTEQEQQQHGGRKVTTFRTNLRTPHDGRITWRAGIALTPCTKIKFVLYRDQARIASTAIMASQLAVASLPHDFALPIKVVQPQLGSNGLYHVHNLQINLTLAEHLLDTVSGEVYASAMADGANGAGGASRAGHVIMVPGSDLMVMLRGYEEISRGMMDGASAYQAPFSMDDDDPIGDDGEDDNDEYAGGTATAAPPARRSDKSNNNSNSPLGERRTNVNNNNSNNNNGATEPFSGEIKKFGDQAPVVVPDKIRNSLPKEAFIAHTVDTDVLRAENNRLAAENSHLRAALQEQEETLHDQESYILTLLEQQGVVGVEGDHLQGAFLLQSNHGSPIRD